MFKELFVRLFDWLSSIFVKSEEIVTVEDAGYKARYQPNEWSLMLQELMTLCMKDNSKYQVSCDKSGLMSIHNQNNLVPSITINNVGSFSGRKRPF